METLVIIHACSMGGGPRVGSGVVGQSKALPLPLDTRYLAEDMGLCLLLIVFTVPSLGVLGNVTRSAVAVMGWLIAWMYLSAQLLRLRSTLCLQVFATSQPSIRIPLRGRHNYPPLCLGNVLVCFRFGDTEGGCMDSGVR